MGSAVEATFVASVMGGMFFALIRGWYSPEVVVFLSMLIVWNVGIISTSEALSGFNNPSMLVIGALFVVVASIVNSGLADTAARRIFGLTSTFSCGFLRLMLCAATMSAFVNNTPVVALLIPVTTEWARTRGFSPSLLLMPLAFVCSLGGILTTVGGGTNLLIQGLLYEAGNSDESIRPFGFLEPALVGLPLAVTGIAYLLVATPRVLARPGGAARAGRSRDRSEDLLTEVEICRNSELIGQPFALILATLGLPEETLVKVRRRSPREHAVGKPSRESVASYPDSSEECEDDVLDEDDEESNRVSWAGRIGSSAATAAGAAAAGVASSSRGVDSAMPFVLRRRAPYQRLGTEASAERSEKQACPATPCIEMATIHPGEVAGTTSSDEVSTPTNSARSTGAAVSALSNDAKRVGPLEDIYNVSPGACVRPGDVLILSCDREAMVRLQGSAISQSRKGLKIVGVSTRKLPRHGTIFLELILSRSTKFLGRIASVDNASFAATFGFSVVAFRLKGSTGGGVDLIGSARASCGGGGGLTRTVVGIGLDSSAPVSLPTNGSHSPAAAAAAAAEGVEGVFGVNEAVLMSGDGNAAVVVESPLHSTTPTPLLSSPAEEESPAIGNKPPRKVDVVERRPRGEAFKAGDVVLVLATEAFLERARSTREFLYVENLGRLPEPTGWFHFCPLVIFAAMLAWVLAVDVGMVRAAFAACAVLILGGWVEAEKAVAHVNWALLLLIGSSLGFSKAITTSGLADYVGESVQKSGMSPAASIFVLFGVTMICTALISNNAAAALMVPVALSMARDLEADYKPFAMAVLVAASCSFLTPIGTPPNTMVWGPGGYNFQEYAKLGAPLSIVYWIVASVVIPLVFPF